jgi:hypothetical protein
MWRAAALDLSGEFCLRREYAAVSPLLQSHLLQTVFFLSYIDSMPVLQEFC